MPEEEAEPSLQTVPGGGTPLRKFEGVLQAFRFEDRTFEGESGTRVYKVVMFDFVDLNVLRTEEPWPFPIATIQIGYSKTTETRWGRFAQSVRRLLPESVDLKPLLEQKQTWEMLPISIRQRNDETKAYDDVKVEAWQVVGIQGVTVEDLTDYLLDLADGKTENDFYQVALTDAKVMGNPGLVEEITNRRILPSYMALGLLTRDAEGVLHKAATQAKAVS